MSIFVCYCRLLSLTELAYNRALTIIIKGTLCFKFKFLPLWILLVVFKVPFDIYERQKAFTYTHQLQQDDVVRKFCWFVFLSWQDGNILVYRCAAYHNFFIIRHSFQLLSAMPNFICLYWNLSCWVFAQGQIILESLNENNMVFSKNKT